MLKGRKFVFSKFWRLEAPDQGSPGSVSGEGDFPGLQMAIFSWCFHVMERERESSLVYFLIRALILLDQGPTCLTSFSFNYFHKGPSPNIETLRYRASTYEFWGTLFSSWQCPV